MGNLFNIEEKYLSLMSQIEELEGEITEELEQELSINKDELESKIKAYHYIILSKQTEALTIDDEIKRLQSLKKVKENIVKRLKKSILGAVNLFGYDGKSGNKKLDFDTISLYTKNSTAVEVNEDLFIKNAIDAIDEDITEDWEAFIYDVKMKLSIKEYEEFKEWIVNKMKFEMNPAISKTKIKELIEDGIEVRAAQIVTNQSVIIK